MIRCPSSLNTKDQRYRVPSPPLYPRREQIEQDLIPQHHFTRPLPGIPDRRRACGKSTRRLGPLGLGLAPRPRQRPWRHFEAGRHDHQPLRSHRSDHLLAVPATLVFPAFLVGRREPPRTATETSESTSSFRPQRPTPQDGGSCVHEANQARRPMKRPQYRIRYSSIALFRRCPSSIRLGCHPCEACCRRGSLAPLWEYRCS